MTPTRPGSLAAALWLVLLAPTFARAADTLDDIGRQLDRVEDLFRSDSSDLAHAMLDTAIEDLDAAVKAQPDDARAHFLRGRAYVYRNDGKAADKAYARAAELAPDNAEYQFVHGLRLADANDGEAAMARFQRVTELDPGHAEARLMLGVLHARAGDDAAAMEWFEKVLALDPKHAGALGNVGQLHQTRGRHAEALAAYEKATESAPGDWRFRSKLVQLYQALGRHDDRDRERKVLIEMWHDDKVDQPMFCREQFEAAGRKVQAYEYFELRGERALRYSFIVLKPDGKTPDYRVTLGSYATTNEIARAGGRIGKDERLFHLDGYYPDGEHRTFGMFKQEPSYEATRVRVVEVLEEKLKPVSKSKAGEDGRLDIEVEAGE